MISTRASFRRLPLMFIGVLVVGFVTAPVAFAVGSADDAAGDVVFVGEDEDDDDGVEEGAGGEGQVPPGGVALLIAGALGRRFGP
jgi:hypothetical protein